MKMSDDQLDFNFSRQIDLQRNLNLKLLDGLMVDLFNKNKSLCLINPDDPLLDIKTIHLFIKNSQSTLVNFKTPHARLLKDKEKYVEAIKKYINKY